MLPLLPAIIMALGGVAGAGGIGKGAKGAVDLVYAARVNRAAQERNEKNILYFQACSDNLDKSIERLGDTRLKITKNFAVFTEAFEKIKNKPDFSQGESIDLPTFDFNEIKDVSVFTNGILAGAFGAIGGNVMAAAAAGGIKSAIVAFAKASTGKAIKDLAGAAAYNAALAAIGGGAIAAGGGGMALGALVLNVAGLGVGALFQGIALAFAGSKSRKKADEAYRQMEDNEAILKDATDMQLSLTGSADKMIKAVTMIYKNTYSVLVLKLRDLVELKTDYAQFSQEEKLLLENTVLAVSILHNLNNIPLYKVKKMNDNGEIEEVEENTEEFQKAILQAKKSLNEKGI